MQVMQSANPIPCILRSALHMESPLAQVPFLARPFAIPDLVRLGAVSGLCLQATSPAADPLH